MPQVGEFLVYQVPAISSEVDRLRRRFFCSHWLNVTILLFLGMWGRADCSAFPHFPFYLTCSSPAFRRPNPTQIPIGGIAVRIALLCAAWMIPCPEVTAIVMVYLTVSVFKLRRVAA